MLDFHLLIKGLELGLAIAQGLSTALDLKLSLSSRHGRGSGFKFILPLADMHAPLEAPGSLGIQLPTLIITGDTAPERLREASASGYPLLHKPVKPDQLYQSLLRLVAWVQYWDIKPLSTPPPNAAP